MRTRIKPMARNINVRASEETIARLIALSERMSAALGMDVSQGNVISRALIELEKLFPPTQPEAEKKGKNSK
jgi:hypothetical protein